MIPPFPVRVVSRVGEIDSPFGCTLQRPLCTHTSSCPANLIMNIVFIHGRDQAGEIPRDLQAVWEGGWERGLARAGLTRPVGVEVHFPFYGDLLERLVLQSAAQENAAVPVYRSAGDSLAAFQDQVFEEVAQREFSEAEIRAAEVEAGQQIRVAGAIRGHDPGATRSLQNWPVVRYLAGLVDRTPLKSTVLKQITRDVYLYLTDDAIRQEVHQLVRNGLPTEPCIVVGHSLGSILAYLLLHESVLRASRFITLGSPLAMRSITGLMGRQGRPAGLEGHWLNAFDRRDVVALRRLSPPDFLVNPEVINKGDVDNFTENRHSIQGYLEDPEVARWIHAGLG